MQSNRSALFRGRHFAEEIIVLCVRWYLRFSLSYRDLEELMTERGLSVDHTTVWRWVQRYAPELDRRVRRELKRTGTSWRVDETYVRVAGRWMYLYRALDSCGATLDFYLSENRDATTAKQFLSKVLAAANHPRPRVINVDGNPSYPHAVSRLKQGEVGSALPVSDLPLPEQHRRARPPSPQTTDQRQARLPIVRGGAANHPRL